MHVPRFQVPLANTKIVWRNPTLEGNFYTFSDLICCKIPAALFLSSPGSPLRKDSHGLQRHIFNILPSYVSWSIYVCDESIEYKYIQTWSDTISRVFVPE